MNNAIALMEIEIPDHPLLSNLIKNVVYGSYVIDFYYNQHFLSFRDH